METSDMELLKQVRGRSGAGVSACRSALEESGMDVEKALEILQKKGILKAAAKAATVAAEGRIVSYVHNARMGILLEVNCVTDFASRSQEFVKFCEEVALQIVGLGARWVSVSDVPREAVDKQAEIFREQLRNEGKPEKAWAKIFVGKFDKWYSENCLTKQESIVHPGRKIEELRAELSAKLGENVVIRRFVRLDLGEGIEKKVVDFQSEVEQLAGGKP